MKTSEIGAALDGLVDDARRNMLDLVRQYREFGLVGVLRQAVDTPHRARAQIAAWIAAYNARNGAGTAQTFLASCLTAAGSSRTLAQIDAALATLETQAAVLVNNVQTKSWTWQQVASAIEAQITFPAEETFTYAALPMPSGYVSVWGD